MQSMKQENANIQSLCIRDHIKDTMRVLCISRGEVGGQLVSQLTQFKTQIDLICCNHFMGALGELATQKVDIIIGPASGLRLAATATTNGLKRLSQNAKLILVQDDSQTTLQEALEAGFDAAIDFPIDPAELKLAILGAEQIENKTPEVENTLLQQETLRAAEVQNAETDNAVEELGDVDLVDAILEGEGRASKTALQLIQQQSGIAEIEWVKKKDAVPQTHVVVGIELADRDYGYLHAPQPITADELEVWGEWLARWLALEEKMLQLEMAAMRDELTGAWNRRYFYRFLGKIMKRAREDRSQVTVMVFDIDNFKIYNDKYGHAAGDEILTETVKLMQSVVREHDVVARVGGDEFAVIFWDAEGPRKANSRHPEDVLAAAERFQKAVCRCEFPKLADQARGVLTISGGLASYPWDGRTGEELVEKADVMALESKRRGKNAITYGLGIKTIGAKSNPIA